MKKAMQAGTLSEETFPEAWITTLAMATGDLYDATAYVCDHASAWGVDKPGSWRAVRAPEPLRC